MKNPLSLVKACVPVQTPKCLVSYLEHINVLTYDEKPNYALLQQLFHKELTKMKCSDKSDVLDWVLGKAKAVKVANICIYNIFICNYAYFSALQLMM